MNEILWFKDPASNLYDTPVAAFARSRHEAAPTPQRVKHDLFGLGQIVGPSSDWFPNLGRLAAVRFDLPYRGQTIFGAFNREFLSQVSA